MGTRLRLGHGFTIGASGLRYGRGIPGIKGSYVSTGASGTLLTGFGVRHWQPHRRPPVGTSARPRCQGLTKAGAQCANSASWSGVVDGRAGPPMTCQRHQDQAGALERTRLETEAAVATERATYAAVLEARRMEQRGTRRVSAWKLRWRTAHPEAYAQALIRNEERRAARSMFGWTPWIVVALVVFIIWTAFAQQATTQRTDQRAGLTAANTAGAPGICIDNNASDTRGGRYPWTVTATGWCDPSFTTHFVPVAAP
jgi:hypothetical protein